jgi:hypothetical protein
MFTPIKNGSDQNKVSKTIEMRSNTSHTQAVYTTLPSRTTPKLLGGTKWCATTN